MVYPFLLNCKVDKTHIVISRLLSMIILLERETNPRPLYLNPRSWILGFKHNHVIICQQNQRSCNQKLRKCQPLSGITIQAQFVYLIKNNFILFSIVCLLRIEVNSLATRARMKVWFELVYMPKVYVQTIETVWVNYFRNEGIFLALTEDIIVLNSHSCQILETHVSVHSRRYDIICQHWERF